MTGVPMSSASLHPCISPTDRLRHKELLSTSRTMPPSTSLPVLNAASLTPASTTPGDHSQTSASMDFVSSIELMRVPDTRKSVRDGATLYQVETCTIFQSSSNIPTVRNSGVQTSATTATRSSASASNEDAEERTPDFCVRRRFAAFARLRHEAIAASCVNAHFLCQYCRQFQTYARFHAAQPLWFLRVVTTEKQRKKILARFLADLAAFAQSKAQRHRHCLLRQTLPKLLQQFLTD